MSTRGGVERLGHDVVGYDRLDGHDLLDSAAVIEAQWQADPASEWTPTWEYGQFVDVRDVADAVQRALDAPLAGHHRMLLCAAGIAATEPSLIMAGRSAFVRVHNGSAGALRCDVGPTVGCWLSTERRTCRNCRISRNLPVFPRESTRPSRT